MEYNVIPVFFSTDDKYVFPTSVTICSMMENKKRDTFYEIIVMITDDLTEIHKEKLLRLQEMYEGCSIKLVDNCESLFVNTVSRIKHISNVAFYRLAIPNMFPCYDKCIYMDGDIIVLGDLSEIYNVELDDNYIAGTINYRHASNLEKSESIRRIINIPSMKRYIYGAPIVYNAKLIRENNITNYFMEELSKGYGRGDQDVLNICCYGKIKVLPLFTNLLNRFVGVEELLMQGGLYSYEEIEKARSNPLLIHFAGRIEKPWIYGFTKKADVWWRYAEKCDFFEEYKCLKDALIYIKDIHTRKEVISKAQKYKRVFLRGCGEDTQNIYNWIVEQLGVETEIFVTDYNIEQAKKFGARFKTVEESIELYKEGKTLYILLTQSKNEDIKNELVNKGIDDNDIFSMFVKGREYYLSLDSKYYCDEIDDICNGELIDCMNLYDDKDNRYYLGLWFNENKEGAVE